MATADRASGSPADRIVALQAEAQQPGYLDANAVELVGLLVKALPDCANAEAARAVQRFVDAGVAGSEAFLKTLAGAVVKHEKAKLKPHEAAALAGWAAALLRQLDLGASKKAAAKLAECLAAFLEQLADAAGGSAGGGADAAGAAAVAAQRAAVALLRRKPELGAEMLALAKARASGPLVQLLLRRAEEAEEDGEEGAPAGAGLDSASLVAAFLPVWVDKVLGAKERAPAGALAAWAPLLAAVPEEQLTASLLPTAVRMAKRSPEPALAAAAALLHATPADLSAGPAAGELWPVLLQQSRHSKEPVRQLAVECVRQLAAHTSDPGVAGQHAAAAVKVLDGSAEGKLKSAAERASVAAVIAALADAPGRGASAARAAAPVAEALCRYYGEEVAALGRLVAEGCAKLAARLDGLLALLAAAYVAAADLSADEVLAREQVWEAACRADSPLLAAATASKLAPEDAALVAELAEVLLTQHSRHLGGEASPAAAAAAATLALLLLHHEPSVRAAAAGAAARVAAASDALAAGLAAGLRQWAAAPGDAAVASVMEGGAGAGKRQRRFGEALLAVVPSDDGREPPSLELVCALLLLAHHPTVAGSGAGSSSAAWQAATGRLGPDVVSAVLAAAPDAAAATIAAPLLSPAAEAAPDGAEAAAAAAAAQAGACGALRAAMAAAAEPLLGPVLRALAPLLDRSAHDALSAKELKIYSTPPDKLSNEDEGGSIIPGEIFEEMLSTYSPIPPVAALPDVPPAAAPAAAAAPPAAPATPAPAPAAGTKAKPAAAATRPSVAAERAARGIKPAGAKPGGLSTEAAKARRAQLEAEAAVRARVEAVREALARGLAALGAAAAGRPAFTAAQLGTFGPPVLPLLTSPLVGGSAAFDCARRLAACLPGELARAAQPLAASLRLVALTQREAEPDWQALAERACMRAAVEALELATGAGAGPGAGRPLPGPAYTFCFPVLCAVLNCPQPTPLHEAALGVVALHVDSPDIRREEAFALLYHVLEVTPAYRDRVQPLLRALCRATPAADVPALSAALRGLVAGPPHVRAAAAAALAAAPALEAPDQGGAAPEDPALLALLWLARCDPQETNAEAGRDLWDYAEWRLPPSFVLPLMVHLASRHADVRAAAASALAEGVRLHPSAVQQALTALISLYETGSPGSPAAGAAGAAPGSAAPPEARTGAALALQALAPALSPAQLHATLDFLLSKGLADPQQGIRDQARAAA
eukprot:scaffold14.g1204.t1